MKKNYKKTTLKALPLKLDRPLLTASNDSGFKATISGCQADNNESDGFSQE